MTPNETTSEASSPDSLWTTSIEGFGEPKRGKVRDLYDLGETLLLVACDRLSAYDHVLEPAIPGKGKILNQLTNFWFDQTRDLVPNHLVHRDAGEFPDSLAPFQNQLRGRAVIVKKAAVVPFECVARGYLAGSAFKEYRTSRSVCGIPLPDGLVRASELEEPVFTPATKAETGHDENVDFATMSNAIGSELAERMRDLTLELYKRGREHARERGLLLADTKFEFGLVDNDLVLIDEVLTPDSSRYWDAEAWEPGVEPASFDKQFVRNWLDDQGWDHDSAPPRLPDEVVAGTRRRYIEAFERISGRPPQL